MCSSAKCQGLGEGKYRWEAVLIYKYDLSQSYHWSQSSGTAEPVTVTHDDMTVVTTLSHIEPLIVSIATLGFRWSSMSEQHSYLLC